MAATDKRHGLGIVHSHLGESAPDVGNRSVGIGFTEGPFRVDVDQAKCGWPERELAIAIILFLARSNLLLFD